MVEVHGITYDDVPHWLYNIHCVLVEKFIESLEPEREDSNILRQTEKSKELHRDIKEFDAFVEKFLGFKWCTEGENKYTFVEKNE